MDTKEKEIFDKVIKAMNTKSITVNMLNLAFAAILIYERDNHIYMREITDFIDKYKKA